MTVGHGKTGPLASVVIPSYNHGPFIEEAVHSVLGQDTDLELVVVDDGSSDDSRRRLESIDDCRLRLILQENRGAHAALNRGIEASRGQIVFLLNSDDHFHPQRLPRFLDRFAQQPELCLLTSWLQLIDAHGLPIGVKEAWHNLPPWPQPRPGKGLADGGEPGLALLQSNYVSTTSNVAFRRAWWQRQGLCFSPLRYTHDWEALLAAAGRGPMAVLAEPLVSYRVHASNTLAEGRAKPGDPSKQGDPAERSDPAERGEGAMRFEILWTVARHAHPLCRHFAAQGHDMDELRSRAWRSLPRFGRDDLLAMLLQLRGDGPSPSKTFDALLQPSHPLRRRMVELLAGGDR